MKLSLDCQKACEDGIPAQDKLESWIETTLIAAQQNQDRGLTIRFVESDESRQLNSNYRQKDQPTNVLSFPFEQPIGVEDQEVNNYLGDLVICSAVVIQEAILQNKSLQAHWAHMCVHGCLHLLGFDHITTEDAERMEQLEIEVLKKLSIPNPYIEASKN